MTRVLIFVTVCSFRVCLAQEYVSKVWQADQGDGTYKNPILHVDYSDPDVIRVGDDYYMTSSSFHCVPGLPILHSKDLVNWKIVNYALTDLDLAGVPQGFFDKPQHGKGVWAPSIRYHQDEYLIYWGDPDFGIYVVKTKNILGKWDEPIPVLPGKGRIDPCPLFDDDGKIYLAYAWAGSRANLNSIITVCELDSTGTRVVGEEMLVFDGNDGVNHTVEGGKFYKKDGFYYLLAPAGGVATGWQLAMRSTDIFGPYEVKRVLAQGSTDINGPHQGGLVDTQTGEWWFIHFQDKGVYGRVVHLQPVRWKDGWPVMGKNDNGYCGEPVVTYRKPNVGQAYPIVTPMESDGFDAHLLGLQWSWHANPGQAWAFPSTSGYLRMYGQYYPDNFQNFWDIPNLLLQKFPAPAFSATVKATAVLQNEGDRGGLVVMGLDYAYLALVRARSGYELKLVSCLDAEHGGKESILADVTSDPQVTVKYNHTAKQEHIDIYFRLTVSDGGLCTFSYSHDGEKYKKITQPFQAKQGKWIGAKTGLFVLNKESGTQRSWMDVDWFTITTERRGRY